MLRHIASVLSLGLLLACGGAQSSATAEPSEGPRVVEVVVTSGVPQPAPTQAVVSVGTPVTLRVRGLGPARASVLAPDGSAVATTDAPLTDDGSTGVVGTEQRFTPPSAGTYRVVLAETPSVDLAHVVVR